MLLKEGMLDSSMCTHAYKMGVLVKIGTSVRIYEISLHNSYEISAVALHLHCSFSGKNSLS